MRTANLRRVRNNKQTAMKCFMDGGPMLNNSSVAGEVRQKRRREDFCRHDSRCARPARPTGPRPPHLHRPGLEGTARPALRSGARSRSLRDYRARDVSEPLASDGSPLYPNGDHPQGENRWLGGGVATARPLLCALSAAPKANHR